MRPVTHTGMLLWVYVQVIWILYNTYTGSPSGTAHITALGHVNLSSLIDSNFQQRSTLCPILLQTINPDKEILLSTVSTICPKWRWSDLNHWKLFSSGSFEKLIILCGHHNVSPGQNMVTSCWLGSPWQMNDQSHKIAYAIWRIWLDFDKSMIKNVYLSQYFLSS